MPPPEFWDSTLKIVLLNCFLVSFLGFKEGLRFPKLIRLYYRFYCTSFILESLHKCYTVVSIWRISFSDDFFYCNGLILGRDSKEVVLNFNGFALY